MTRIASVCVLFAALFASAAGCVVIPLPPHTVEGVNAGAKVGRAGSWTRPLKVGSATRDDVRRRLGEPWKTSGDGRQWAYAWTTRTGIAFGFTLGGNSTPIELIDRDRIMWLNFDDADLLTAFDITDDWTIGPGYGFPDFSGLGIERSNPFASSTLSYHSY